MTETNDTELAQTIAEESETRAQEMIVRSQIIGLLVWFLPPWIVPIAAGVTEGLNQLANKRMYSRLKEMREAMHERLDEVDKNKVDKEWFQSEEYQTMLFEAVRQVMVTADRKRIAMLGNALANAGIDQFRADSRKELFLQLIRDLTPHHVAVLKQMLPDESLPPQIQWRARRSITTTKEEELAVLQMLAANGLVTESLKESHMPPNRQSSYRQPSPAEMAQNLRKLIAAARKPPTRVFQLSTLGRDLLNFVGFAQIVAEETQETKPS
jgi:hypothetical protein